MRGDLEKEIAGYVLLDFHEKSKHDAPELVVMFPRPQLRFNDPYDMSKRRLDEIKNTRDALGNLGPPPFEDAIIRLEIICNEFRDINHPGFQIDSREVEARRVRFTKLQEMLTKSIGKAVAFDRELSVRFQDEHLRKLAAWDAAEKFSDGEKKLVDIITSLLWNNRVTRDTIILLDEPELHIHPAAVIETLDRLSEVFPNSQMFVATHCVPLVAHLGHQNVWWVRDHSARYFGRRSREVLEGLLGGASNVDRLRELLLEPDRLAALHFAFEALFAPAAILDKGEDPQMKQILENLRCQREKLEHPVRVLDFGASRGRLISALSTELGSEIGELLDYVALEPRAEFADDCKTAIERTFGTSDGRFYSSRPKLMAAHTLKRFDKVLMCNVFHEVPPEDWLLVANDIRRCLSDAGKLLIVEDHEIPHGELAHTAGFIVVDGTALGTLFRLSTLPHTISPSEVKYKDRLFAYELDAPCLENISDESRIDALTWCRDQSPREIVELRKNRAVRTYRDGILHSLWNQQHTNSSIALDTLSGPKTIKLSVVSRA